MSTSNAQSEPTLELDFILRMAHEIEANQGKGDWRRWIPDSRGEAIDELQHHVNKLNIALSEIDPDRIEELSADVANGAMMIFRLYGCINRAKKSEQED